MHRLKALRELRKEHGAEVFLVGGAVRDLIRKKVPNDIDTVVRGIEPAVFEDFLRKKGTLSLVGKSFGVYLFKPHGVDTPIEIAFPRTERSTGEGHRQFEVSSNPGISIKEDSGRRDFTINAMYISLDDIRDNGKFDRKDVIDFHHGLEHIKRRLIVAVGDPNDRIKEDPLRMLRALVLIARTGYRLEGDIFAALKRNAELITSVSWERIGKEIVKIMESSKPSRAFKTMSRTGLIEHVLPELADCVGCGQNPKYHSYPVFEHVIYAADAACSMTDDIVIRFSALCHDLGKAPTREVRPGGSGPNDVSFHNHEIVSTKLTFKMFQRLKFPKDFTLQVIHLIRFHQYKYERTWTDKAVRRFIRKAGILKEHLDDLEHHPQFVLRMADRMGNKLKAHLPVTIKQRDFQNRITKVYHASSAHSLRELAINGDVIKQELNLAPGPKIGQIMRFLFETVEDTPEVNNSGDLIRIARQFLEENDGSDRTDRTSASASQNTSG